MYQWYQGSAICYAYLSDVQLQSRRKAFVSDVRLDGSSRISAVAESLNDVLVDKIDTSKWWTRGWTLQELIAPRIIQFFSSRSGIWHRIGDNPPLLILSPEEQEFIQMY
jgi:hypothetical protein